MHGTQSGWGVSRSACRAAAGGQLGPHALELLTRVLAARALVQLHLRDESAGDAGDRPASLLRRRRVETARVWRARVMPTYISRRSSCRRSGVMSSSSDLERQQALVDACQETCGHPGPWTRGGGQRDLVPLVAALGDAEDDADGLGHLQHGSASLSGLRPRAGRRSVWRSSRRSRSHCSSAAATFSFSLSVRCCSADVEQPFHQERTGGPWPRRAGRGTPGRSRSGQTRAASRWRGSRARS